MCLTFLFSTLSQIICFYMHKLTSKHDEDEEFALYIKIIKVTGPYDMNDSHGR